MYTFRYMLSLINNVSCWLASRCFVHRHTDDHDASTHTLNDAADAMELSRSKYKIFELLDTMYTTETWVQYPADHPWEYHQEQGKYLQVARDNGCSPRMRNVLRSQCPLNDYLKYRSLEIKRIEHETK